MDINLNLICLPFRSMFVYMTVLFASGALLYCSIGVSLLLNLKVTSGSRK